MNRVLTILGIIVLALVLASALIGAGFLVGRATTARQVTVLNAPDGSPYPYGAGRPGMMLGWDEGPFPDGGRGMTPGEGFNRGGRPGRMGDFGRMPMFGQGAAVSAEPLTIEATRTAVENFLTELGRENLAVGEIMIFENNAYAVVDDTATGQGAFEVLVEPGRQVVHLEYGPSMMWNTIYGMHGSDPIFGMGRMPGRMMMGGLGPEPVPSDATPLTETEARAKAQTYVDQSLAGQTLSATAEAFPGYFTFDLEKDGKPTGMLSVNATTGQVWVHTWHGAFVEMSE